MPEHTITEVTGIEAQLAEALSQVRHARHQDSCSCWFGLVGRPLYCTQQESSWSHILNKLLDKATE